MSNKIGFENDSILAGATKAIPVVGANIFSNPGFENWTDPNTPVDWDQIMGNPLVVQDNVFTHGGSNFSVQMVGNNVNSPLVFQNKSGLTVNDGYRASVWAAQNGGGAGVFLVSDLAFPNQTMWWDFINHTWDVVGAGNPPGPNDAVQFMPGAAFGQVTFPVVTVPVGGEITVYFSGSSNAARTVWYDDAALQKIGATPPILTLFDFTNASDPTDFVTGDYISKQMTTGGTPFLHWGQDAGGTYRTDYNFFDFTPKGIATEYHEANLAGGVPTQVECIAAFGAATSRTNGYAGVLKKSGSNNAYVIFVAGSSYYYLNAILAA